MREWYILAAGLLLLVNHTTAYAQSSLDTRVAGDARAAQKILELKRQQQPHSSVDPKKDLEMFIKCGGIYHIGYSNPEDFIVEGGRCYLKSYKGPRIGH